MTKPKAYLIPDIDPELYKEFKAACAYYGLDIKQVFHEHIRNIVRDYRTSIAPLKRPKLKRRKE